LLIPRHIHEWTPAELGRRQTIEGSIIPGEVWRRSQQIIDGQLFSYQVPVISGRLSVLHCQIQLLETAPFEAFTADIRQATIRLTNSLGRKLRSSEGTKVEWMDG